MGESVQSDTIRIYLKAFLVQKKGLFAQGSRDWKILELQINVKLGVEGLQIYLLPMEKQ